MIDLIFDFQMNTILNEKSKKYHSLVRVHLNFLTVYLFRFSIAGLWAIELIKVFKLVEKNERNHSFDDLLTKKKSVSIYPEIYNF